MSSRASLEQELARLPGGGRDGGDLRPMQGDLMNLWWRRHCGRVITFRRCCPSTNRNRSSTPLPEEVAS
ncbi:hypothetical protein PanWU01x14_348200 [Parasponia andersonii]|uniref:Uncharacterized protein n=1 Tax=Parasponia andersonii TaxID=3476 RepID=A0A2P5ABR6_PARAD|nr:hypothetical protein PanWU01x14_348200 [Parasponia andersonii]